jgi:hypothetical protein
MNKLSKRVFGSTKPSDIFFDLLTFERLLTKPVIHIIYWAGLMLLVISAFGVVGASVGVALKEDQPWGWFLALPMLVGGMLFVFAGMLLWRSFCEFYVAIFRIADDLNYLRNENEGQGLRESGLKNPVARASSPEPQPQTQPAPSPLSTARSVAQPADGRPNFETRPSFDSRAAGETRTESRPFTTPEPDGDTSDEQTRRDTLEDPFFRRLTRTDET